MSGVAVPRLVDPAFAITAFLPQLVQTWRERSSADVPLGVCALLTAGAAPWLTYGWPIGDLPVLVASAVTLVLLHCALAPILLHRRAACAPR